MVQLIPNHLVTISCDLRSGDLAHPGKLPSR